MFIVLFWYSFGVLCRSSLQFQFLRAILHFAHISISYLNGSHGITLAALTRFMGKRSLFDGFHFISLPCSCLALVLLLFALRDGIQSFSVCVANRVHRRHINWFIFPFELVLGRFLCPLAAKWIQTASGVNRIIVKMIFNQFDSFGTEREREREQFRSKRQQPWKSLLHMLLVGMAHYIYHAIIAVTKLNAKRVHTKTYHRAVAFFVQCLWKQEQKN